LGPRTTLPSLHKHYQTFETYYPNVLFIYLLEPRANRISIDA
jgi:hypothetical protein